MYTFRFYLANDTYGHLIAVETPITSTSLHRAHVVSGLRALIFEINYSNKPV